MPLIYFDFLGEGLGGFDGRNQVQYRSIEDVGAKALSKGLRIAGTGERFSWLPNRS